MPQGPGREDLGQKAHGKLCVEKSLSHPGVPNKCLPNARTNLGFGRVQINQGQSHLNPALPSPNAKLLTSTRKSLSVVWVESRSVLRADQEPGLDSINSREIPESL